MAAVAGAVPVLAPPPQPAAWIINRQQMGGFDDEDLWKAFLRGQIMYYRSRGNGFACHNMLHTFNTLTGITFPNHPPDHTGLTPKERVHNIFKQQKESLCTSWARYSFEIVRLWCHSTNGVAWQTGCIQPPGAPQNFLYAPPPAADILALRNLFGSHRLVRHAWQVCLEYCPLDWVNYHDYTQIDLFNGLRNFQMDWNIIEPFLKYQLMCHGTQGMGKSSWAKAGVRAAFYSQHNEHHTRTRAPVPMNPYMEGIVTVGVRRERYDGIEEEKIHRGGNIF